MSACVMLQGVSAACRKLESFWPDSSHFPLSIGSVLVSLPPASDGAGFDFPHQESNGPGPWP
jgi:hypothetical protein